MDQLSAEPAHGRFHGQLYPWLCVCLPGQAPGMGNLLYSSSYPSGGLGPSQEVLNREMPG